MQIHELYGQTEAAGPISCTPYGAHTPDNVGVPIFGLELKLVDVPELGYTTKNGCGEVCCRSEFISKGYYKMPEKTAEMFDSDHWLHTGDIGTWLTVRES